MIGRLKRQIEVLFYYILGHLFVNFNATKKISFVIINAILNSKNQITDRLGKELLIVFWGLTISIQEKVSFKEDGVYLGEHKELKRLEGLLTKKKLNCVILSQFYNFIGDTLGTNSNFINKNANDLFGSFVEFIRKDKSVIGRKILRSISNEENKEKSNNQLNSEEDLTDLFISNMSRDKNKDQPKSIIYINYLKIFSMMSSFSKKEFTDDLEKSILELIMFNKDNYFESCVKIYLRINNEILDSHRDLFNSLKDIKALKNTLLNIRMNDLTESEKELYKKFLKSALISLYFTSKGQKNQSYVLGKQSAILSFISNFHSTERSLFMNKFFDFLGFNIEVLKSDSSYFNVIMMKEGVSSIIRLINFTKLVLKNFGITAKDYAKTLFTLFMNIFNFFTAVIKKIKEKGSNENISNETKRIKMIRKIVLDLIIDFYITFVDVDYDEETQTLIKLLRPRLVVLHKLPIASSSTVVKLVSVWSEVEVYKIYLLNNPDVFIDTVKTLNSEQTTNIQAKKIITVITNLLTYNGRDDQYNLSSSKFDSVFNKNNFTFNIDSQNNKLLYYKDNKIDQRISIIGKHLVESNSSFILKTFNEYVMREREIKGNKYMPSESFFDLIRLVINVCTIDNQAELETCLSLFKSILNPKLINAKTTENFGDSAKLYVLKGNSKESFISLFHLIGVILAKYKKDRRFFINTVMNLFVGLNEPELFMSLGEIVNSVLTNDLYSSIETPLLLLKTILTKGTKVDDNLNYDIIYTHLKGMEGLIEEFDYENTEVFLMTLYRLLRVKDLSIKRQALSLFEKYLQNNKSKDNLTKEQHKAIIERVVSCFKNMIKTRLPQDEVFKYSLLFFSSYLSSLKNFDLNLPYSDLSVLEKDGMLIKLIDLKILNRIPALNTLDELLEEHYISYTSLNDILLPLIENLMFSKFDEISNRYANSAIQNSNFINYSNKTIETVQKILSKFEPSQMINYIVKKANFLKKSRSYQDLLVKLISRSLTTFSSKSSLEDVVRKVDFEMRNKTKEILEKEGLFSSLYKKTKDTVVQKDKKKEENVDKNKNKSMVNKLKLSVLPSLKKLLYNKSQSSDMKIKSNLSDAVLKIIRLSNLQDFKREFERLVSELSDLLKSRQSKEREQAMKILFNMAALNGPYFIHLIIEGLISNLKEIRHKHTRNFTINYLLERLVIKKDYTVDLEFNTGCLDYCIDPILHCVIEESFSDMHEEKTDDNFKGKGKEIRKHKSKGIIKAIGSVVDLRGNNVG